MKLDIRHRYLHAALRDFTPQTHPKGEQRQTMWNLGDMFDAVAVAVPPDRQAIVHGDRVVTWGDLDARTNRLARGFMSMGLAPQDCVSILSRNAPAYIESFVACLKARLCPVNINYRYTTDEIAYVLADSATKMLIYQREFAPHAKALQVRFPELRLVCIGETDSSITRFEDIATSGDGGRLAITRDPADPFLLYTGGTTGRPKGVVWPGKAVRSAQMEAPVVRHRPASLDEHAANVKANAAPGRVLPACPLMHGAGINATLSELISGGTSVILEGLRFDPDELWSTVARHKVSRVLIVGDAFGRPMLQALDAAPDKHDLASLKLISSAGLMWSREIKHGLLRHMPWLTLLDVLGASEAAGLGYAIMTKDRTLPTGRFDPAPTTVLISEAGKVLPKGQPGSGFVARTYPLPLGYLGDAKKTAEVFQIIDGERYAVCGDWGRIHDDGTLELIGRGNLVINTGGEKVFVEEVEEALKRVDGVDDAMVIGCPDPTWGSVVVALVTATSQGSFNELLVRDAVRSDIAPYKVPKTIFVVPALPRAESGKSDYARARSMVAELMTSSGHLNNHDDDVIVRG